MTTASTRPAALLLAAFLLLLSAAGAAANPLFGEDYRAVDLDAFVARHKPDQPNQRIILPPRNISFRATLKRHAEKIEVSYLLAALAMMKVEPLPAVSQRLFLATPQGSIIAVYVEDAAAEAIREAVTVEGSAEFLGYHAYSYSKGPAIVVSGVR